MAKSQENSTKILLGPIDKVYMMYYSFTQLNLVVWCGARRPLFSGGVLYRARRFKETSSQSLSLPFF